MITLTHAAVLWLSEKRALGGDGRRSYLKLGVANEATSSFIPVVRTWIPQPSGQLICIVFSYVPVTGDPMKFHMLYSELEHTKYTCSLLSFFPLGLVEYCCGFTWCSCSPFTCLWWKDSINKILASTRLQGKEWKVQILGSTCQLYADSVHITDVSNVEYLLNDGYILATLLGRSCYGPHLTDKGTEAQSDSVALLKS